LAIFRAIPSKLSTANETKAGHGDDRFRAQVLFGVQFAVTVRNLSKALQTFLGGFANHSHFTKAFRRAMEPLLDFGCEMSDKSGANFGHFPQTCNSIFGKSSVALDNSYCVEIGLMVKWPNWKRCPPLTMCRWNREGIMRTMTRARHVSREFNRILAT
jgi:hypothetical protein